MQPCGVGYHGTKPGGIISGCDTSSARFPAEDAAKAVTRIDAVAIVAQANVGTSSTCSFVHAVQRSVTVTRHIRCAACKERRLRTNHTLRLTARDRCTCAEAVRLPVRRSRSSHQMRNRSSRSNGCTLVTQITLTHRQRQTLSWDQIPASGPAGPRCIATRSSQWQSGRRLQ